MDSRTLLRELIGRVETPLYRLSAQAGWSKHLLGHILRGDASLRLSHLAKLRAIIGGDDAQWRAVLIQLVSEEVGSDYAGLIDDPPDVS